MPNLIYLVGSTNFPKLATQHEPLSLVRSELPWSYSGHRSIHKVIMIKKNKELKRDDAFQCYGPEGLYLLP